MGKIAEIIAKERGAADIIADLKKKDVNPPSWKGRLEKEYDTKQHPVTDRVLYPDKLKADGIEKVTRITLGFQKLAAKRITELCFGIPVKRQYNIEEGNKAQEDAAAIIEKIFKKNRIDAVNIARGKQLFAGCEIITIWYGIKMETGKANLYGQDSELKLRCRTFTPMNGDELFPRFDETGDMIAISVQYSRTEGQKTTQYFDTYTSDTHILFSDEGGWHEVNREAISLQKIPAIYSFRTDPIWEDESENIYEMEWALSRNGNYIRKNSKPIFLELTDGDIATGGEGQNDERLVIRLPKGSDGKYVTWDQAIESLKFHVQTIRSNFFTTLQLPDNSFEVMKTTPVSGEARKMMFIDAQLKVVDESGDLLEFFDREVNVIKAFAAVMFPTLKDAINTLDVETIITPYNIGDETEDIANISTATGGKAILSQKEGVKRLGFVKDVDAELKQIQSEETGNVLAR